MRTCVAGHAAEFLTEHDDLEPQDQVVALMAAQAERGEPVTALRAWRLVAGLKVDHVAFLVGDRARVEMTVARLNNYERERHGDYACQLAWLRSRANAPRLTSSRPPAAPPRPSPTPRRPSGGPSRPPGGPGRPLATFGRYQQARRDERCGIVARNDPREIPRIYVVLAELYGTSVEILRNPHPFLPIPGTSR